MGLVCLYKNSLRHWVHSKNVFQQSAVDARRQKDKNPNSSVVAKTQKLLANSSNGYQFIDGSRQTVKTHLNYGNTHAAINSNLFMELNHVNNASCQVELAKAETKFKEAIIFGFFNLQCAQLRKS